MPNETEQQTDQVAPDVIDNSTANHADGSDSDMAEIGAAFAEAEAAVAPATETPVETPAETPTGTEGQPPVDPTVPPVDPTAPPKETPLPPPQEDPEEPKNLSPQNKVNWRALRQTADQLKAERAQLQEKLAQIEQQRNQLPENVQKELQELRQLRQMVDIKNDPEFKKQFNEAIDNNEGEIYKMLEGYGMSKEQIDAIKNGGGTDKIDAEFWQTQVLPKLGDLDRMALAQKLLKTKEIRAGHDKAVADAASKWEQHQQAQVQQRQEFEQNYTQAEQSVIQDFLKNIPEAQFKQLPPNATPQQKAEVEAHNKKFGEYLERDKQMIEGLKRGDPVITTQMRLAANYSFHLMEKNSELISTLQAKDAEIAALNAKVNGIKAAGTTSRQSASAPVAKPSKMSDLDLLNMKDEDAIMAGLDAAMKR